MQLDEEWRIIPGHPDYMVSDMGRVRWLKDKRIYKAGDISTGSGTGNSYRYVPLDGKSFAIHRLVMLAFVGPCPQGIVVNHKNLKKYDNRLINLEYCTYTENTNHAFGNTEKYFPRTLIPFKYDGILDQPQYQKSKLTLHTISLLNLIRKEEGE